MHTIGNPVDIESRGMPLAKWESFGGKNLDGLETLTVGQVTSRQKELEKQERRQ